jgi:hypothetical protein
VAKILIRNKDIDVVSKCGIDRGKFLEGTGFLQKLVTS